MKAKSYAEAEALVKQILGQMANDAEKAKAYNKLVDLAMKQFNDQQSMARFVRNNTAQVSPFIRFFKLCTRYLICSEASLNSLIFTRYSFRYPASVL